MGNVRPLCERPGCFSRGYHWDSCATDGCPGCQPRLALDGKRLCRRDEESIATDARVAARLRAELERVLAGSGQPGEKTSGTADRGMKLNERAIEARASIRHTLVALSGRITDERGFSLPTRRVVQRLPAGFIGPPRLVTVTDESDEALAELIAISASWLAAHEVAGDTANELRALVSIAHSIAYPSGTRVFPVTLCTVINCPGTLKAVLRRTDSLLPSALVCDTDESHSIPASEWLTLGRKLRRAA